MDLFLGKKFWGENVNSKEKVPVSRKYSRNKKMLKNTQNMHKFNRIGSDTRVTLKNLKIFLLKIVVGGILLEIEW